jgi:hypothetical protein
MTALACLLVSWLLCFAIGWGVACSLLPQDWRRERLLVAPVSGAAVLVLLASLCSYAGMTMRQALVPVLVAGSSASLAGMISSRRTRTRRAGDWRLALYVHGVGFIGASSTLWSILLYRAWNPYTDAFTYISIADFLQTHAFFTPATPSPMLPVLTQMSMYQHLGFRMGANFLLALVSALWRVDYSFDVYIPVLALAIWLAVPGLWVLCRRALLMPAWTSSVASTLYALHTAIPVSNALWGFMPQAFGMAFLFPLTALHIRVTGARDVLRPMVLAGLLGGALLLTYPEIVPFAIMAIGMSYGMRLWHSRRRVRRVLSAAVVPSAIAVLVAPVAAWRFVPVIRTQLGAAVGWDPHLSLFDYLGMVAGYRSLVLPVLTRPDLPGAVCRTASVAAVCTMAFALIASPVRIRRQVFALGSGFVLALGWFALVAANPWNPAEPGHPWNTYKIVTYGAFLLVAMWAVGLVRCVRAGGVARVFAVVQVALYLLFFPVAGLSIAQTASKGMRTFTANAVDPIAEYKRLPGVLANEPADEPVNLDIPSDALKHRQLVAYFLRRPVIADWSDDDYISHFLPQPASVGPDVRYPELVYSPTHPPGSIAGLTLRRVPALLLDISFGHGWYGEERDANSAWRWLEARGEIDVTVARQGWLTLGSELAVFGAPRRTVTISLADEPEQTHRYALSGRWFTRFPAHPIHLTPGRHRIVVTADGAPRAGGPRDPRPIRIGLRNVTWTFVPDRSR